MCDDEASKLQDIARGVKANPDAAVDVLAIATLLGDINFDTLVALPEASACGIDDAPSLRTTLLASGHATLDDATSVLSISRLEPDLFAAAFMHRWHVGRWKAGAATQALLSTLAAQYFSTSESVTLPASLNQWNRLAFDNAVRLEQVPNRLDGWLCELLQSHAVLNRALTQTWSSSSLWVGLPKSSAANRDALGDVTDDAARATLLHNRAADMAPAGDREGALKSAREAVELFRKLAQANRAIYTPGWARSLNNLANIQSATGDREGALKTDRKSVV